MSKRKEVKTDKERSLDVLYIRLTKVQKKIIRDQAKVAMMSMNQYMKYVVESICDKKIAVEIADAGKTK